MYWIFLCRLFHVLYFAIPLLHFAGRQLAGARTHLAMPELGYLLILFLFFFETAVAALSSNWSRTGWRAKPCANAFSSCSYDLTVPVSPNYVMRATSFR